MWAFFTALSLARKCFVKLNSVHLKLSRQWEEKNRCALTVGIQMVFRWINKLWTILFSHLRTSLLRVKIIKLIDMIIIMNWSLFEGLWTCAWGSLARWQCKLLWVQKITSRWQTLQWKLAILWWFQRWWRPPVRWRLRSCQRQWNIQWIEGFSMEIWRKFELLIGLINYFILIK